MAVKVQRPNIMAMTKADLGVLQEIARIGSRRLDLARRIDLEGIVREYAGGVLKELDYQNEAYNARRLTDGHGEVRDGAHPRRLRRSTAPRAC